jgi:hypothetical protein
MATNNGKNTVAQNMLCDVILKFDDKLVGTRSAL